MHSVSDLTTSSRKTTGTVPPKLVGSSTTIVGDKMYLFGGRLVAERRMVADLYVFDLDTFVWTKVPPAAGDDPPGARYFHSADSWGNYLIIFGGMGHKPDAASTDDLVVLNDVRFLDITTFRWLPADPLIPSSRSPVDGPSDGAAADPIDPIDPSSSSSSSKQNEFVPRARYAHLSSVSGSRLYIIGGQDLQNAWLDDLCVFDLHSRRWIARKPYPRHAGTYRSVAVSAQFKVRDPARESVEGRTATGGLSSSDSTTGIGPPGGRFSVDRKPLSSRGEFTPSENLVHLPYSIDPTDDTPNDIYLYSNYNFTDVKRELEVLSPQPGEEGDIHMADRSSSMTGTVLPPGLRFPTGAICGNHLIFAGVYLAHSYQSYSIWALDLMSMTWSRLDPGAALAAGSWFRSALWSSPAKGTSKLLIFGNRQGSLVEDYNRRLLAWDDVAVLDLEAFGIYQPPPQALDIRTQELGLAALEESTFADFELVCDDGRRIPCSRRMLEIRWPWFRDQVRVLRDNAGRAISSSSELMSDADSAPPLPSDLLPDSVPLASSNVVPSSSSSSSSSDPRPDPRMTPRALMLGEPYAIALALLQYLYTLALLTPLQHAPAVLSQLLLLGSTYNLQHLQRLVRHAMHRALVPSTSVGVYEVATLCGCQSLQIRALKAVMASSRRNTGRTRGNSNAGGGGGPPRGGGGGGGGSGGDKTNDRDRDRDTQGLTASSLRARAVGGSGSGGGGIAGGMAGMAGIAGNGDTEANGANGTNGRGLQPTVDLSVPRGNNSDGRWPEDVTDEADVYVDVDVDVDADSENETGREGGGEGGVLLNGEFGKMRRALQDEIGGYYLSSSSPSSSSSSSSSSSPSSSQASPASPSQVSPTSNSKSSRIRHTVNLSMDSIYLALQNADNENDLSLLEETVPPESSTLDPGVGVGVGVGLPPLPTIAMPYVLPPPIRTSSISISSMRPRPRPRLRLSSPTSASVSSAGMGMGSGLGSGVEGVEEDVEEDLSPMMTFAIGPNPPSEVSTPISASAVAVAVTGSSSGSGSGQGSFPLPLSPVSLPLSPVGSTLSSVRMLHGRSPVSPTSPTSPTSPLSLAAGSSLWPGPGPGSAAAASSPVESIVSPTQRVPESVVDVPLLTTTTTGTTTGTRSSSTISPARRRAYSDLADLAIPSNLNSGLNSSLNSGVNHNYGTGAGAGVMMSYSYSPSPSPSQQSIRSYSSVSPRSSWVVTPASLVPPPVVATATTIATSAAVGANTGANTAANTAAANTDANTATAAAAGGNGLGRPTPRLSLPGDERDRDLGGDTDQVGVAGAVAGGGGSSNGSHHSRSSARPSPLTPESPVLYTPADPDPPGTPVFVNGHGFSAFALDAIEEGGLRGGGGIGGIGGGRRYGERETGVGLGAGVGDAQKRYSVNNNNTNNNSVIANRRHAYLQLQQQSSTLPPLSPSSPSSKMGKGATSRESYNSGRSSTVPSSANTTTTTTTSTSTATSNHSFINHSHSHNSHSGHSGHAYASANYVDVVDVDIVPELNGGRKGIMASWSDLSASGNANASHVLREMKSKPLKKQPPSLPLSPPNANANSLSPSSGLSLLSGGAGAGGKATAIGQPMSSPSTSVFAGSAESSEHSSSKASMVGGVGSVVVGSSGGGFLSKAKIKRKKKGESGTPTMTSTSTSTSSPPPSSTSFGGTASMSVHSLSLRSNADSVWTDQREMKKAAKAEEKRRKKEEERKRREMLAAQFSAGRQQMQQQGQRGNDVTSVVSSGSSERRRAANEWIEDSVGMYGSYGFAAF